MGSAQVSTSRASVHVENIGGITDADVELVRGVNVLTGRNATNRTSFLRAIMAALGSDSVSLKGDADAGLVELTLGEETYTRRLARDGGDVALSGSPYLDDPELADLFAFLLESNPARRAVARGDDLRGIIMRPIDTDAIRDEIERLEAERRKIDRSLEERGSLQDRLAELEVEQERLKDEIEAKQDELAAKRAEIEAADADLEETREEQALLDTTLGELQDRRSDLDEVRFRIETEQETLDRLRDDLADVETELADLPDDPTDASDDLEDRISELRERKRRMDARINQLQGIIQFNQRMLDGEGLEGLDVLDPAGTGSAEELTGRLLADGNSVVCWTCGTETDREAVEEMLGRLRDHHRALVDRRDAVDDELDDATQHQAERREIRRRHQQLLVERRRIEEEIEETTAALDRLTEQRDDIEEEIQRLEADAEEIQDETVSAIIDLHGEANELEFELNQLESELAAVEDDIEAVEDRLDELESVEDRRQEVEADLESARTRIERLEEEAIESFNHHMERVLSILEYDNIERIWLERKRRQEGEHAFALHVVRTTDSGAAYEDTIDHLSESEREVTGLVFALAGYLSHGVHETVPFMLLDSLEAIDSNRIVKLIDYFQEHVPFLVVALLPEDAEAVDDRHRRITSI